MFLIFLCFLICAYVSFFGAFLSHGVSQIIQVMNDHNLSIETNGDDWGSPILGNPILDFSKVLFYLFLVGYQLANLGHSTKRFRTLPAPPSSCQSNR